MDFTKAKGTASKLDREAKKCLKKNYLETKSQILPEANVNGRSARKNPLFSKKHGYAVTREDIRFKPKKV